MHGLSRYGKHRQNKKSGVDIVSDGECSTISYVTYVNDRYTGFSVDNPRA